MMESPQHDQVPLRHRLLAALVAALWGVNFLAIHTALEHFPPFLCGAIRWTVMAIPTLLFVPRPRVPVRYLLGYGVGFGVLQFAFLYWGMAIGMPAGLASLVLQSSAPFTVILGALLMGDRPSRRAAIGVGVAVAGLAVVGSQRMAGAALLPFVLTVLGGLGWALGNLASRAARPEYPLRLTMWMSVVPPVPMLALSLGIEGPDAIAQAMSTSFEAPVALLGIAYTVLVATVVGSGIWTWLMARHPAGTVAPWSMLVPVVGMSAAWLVLGERPHPVETFGGALVVAGVIGGMRTAPSLHAHRLRREPRRAV